MGQTVQQKIFHAYSGEQIQLFKKNYRNDGRMSKQGQRPLTATGKVWRAG